MTGGTAEAAGHADRGVRAFALAYGDAMAAFEAARAAAPACALGHIGKAWLCALANDAMVVTGARPLLETLAELPLNEREGAHVAALGHAIEGHRAAATEILDRHLMRYPRDLLGHYAAMLLDAFQGRFGNVRNRSLRALPHWPDDLAGHGIFLSFYGFGLEEAGDYARAEDVSRRAAELEPHGYWPHHAVSHVLEMTGRPREGLAWMAEREGLWSGAGNVNRVHIWWHRALFHVELGETAAALDIYDGPVLATQRPVGISLTNATALLWRLEMLGCEAGDRWQLLAKLWDGHADGRLCLFADVHAAMSAIRAGRGADLDALRGAMRRTAASGTEAAAAYRDIGLPAVDGLAAYAAGDFARAAEMLLAARPHLWRLGGSHAQRDVIDWTLAEAAIRAGARDIAIGLANERLGLRPSSAPSRALLRRAESIAA